MSPNALARIGRVWKFGDNINTDLIQPSAAFRLAQTEQHTLVFSGVRPGWIREVSEGDIMIAGRNFGVGSGRPIGALLRACGIVGLVAESLNGLGRRNCINFALPAMECRGITSLFQEGQTASVDFCSGKVENIDTRQCLYGKPLPPLFQEVVVAGGIVQMLIRGGFIEPTPTNSSAS